MFYALAIVTFIATILFYSLYPRNDGMRMVEMPQAKTELSEMIAVHNAAVDAAKVIVYDKTAHRNQMDYERWYAKNKLGVKGHNDGIKFEVYSQFLPTGFTDKQNFFPRLWCTDNSSDAGNVKYPCNHSITNYAAPATDTTTDYIVTLSNGPEQNPLYRRALGELTLLHGYSNEDNVPRLSTYCGTIDCTSEGPAGMTEYDPNGRCVLTNTRDVTIRLPRIIGSGENHDFDGYLACITRIGVTYNYRKRRLIRGPQDNIVDDGIGD